MRVSFLRCFDVSLQSPQRQVSCNVSTARCRTFRQDLEIAPVKALRCKARTTSWLSAGSTGTVPRKSLLFKERCFKLLKFSKHSGSSPAELVECRAVSREIQCVPCTNRGAPQLVVIETCTEMRVPKSHGLKSR